MTTYVPDNWVIIKIDGDDPHYRVLGGRSGGYLDGDSWRMNSGIVSVKETADVYEFYGASGSCYICYKSSNVVRMNMAHVIAQLAESHGDKVSVLEPETKYMDIDWII